MGMTTWGIRHQVLLLAVVPTLTVSILLVAYFTSSRLQDLEQNFYDRGEAIALRLAQASKEGVFSRNTQLLQSLAEDALKEHDLKSITSYTKTGDEISSTGKKSLQFQVPKLNSRQATYTHKEETANTLAITIPIHRPFKQANPRSNSDLSLIESLQNESLVGWLKIEFDTSIIHLREYEVLLNTSILLLFGLSVSGLHALQMGRKVTRPILEMAQAVERIKEGDLTTRIRSSAYPELKILESGINTMAEALANAHADLKNKIDTATSNLRRSLETIEVQNLELELARQAAENASQIKTEFLANMSHEIRTPLNAVTGFIRLLQKTPLDEKQKTYLETLQRSSNTLLSLINEVLDFTKIESGQSRIEKYPTDIYECVDEAINLMTPYANEKGILLIPLIYSDVPHQILADPLRLKQILNNLLSNAIKFTNQGSVTIRVMLENESKRKIVLRVTITDTGIGISPSEQRALFQFFGQANDDISRKFGGSGLGLTICKRLVEQMNGSIDLESQPHIGTTVWFTFQATKFEQAELTPAIPQLTLEEPDLNILSRMRVLAIDDNSDNLTLIKILLEELKIQVTALTSGLEGLDRIKARHNDFDIILMDIRMPNFDGIQTTHAIRAFEKSNGLPPIPIIALTAHAFISEREALLSAGVDDYLMKPIEEPMLITLLQKWGKQKKETAMISNSPSRPSHPISSTDAVDPTYSIPASHPISSTDPIDPTHSIPPNHPISSADPIESTLKVIDRALGLKLAANKADIAKEFFSKLIQELPKDQININRAFQQEDWETLRDVAHRLHGACCYCGVPALKHATQQLEKALINHAPEIIKPKIDALNIAIEDVLKAQHLYLAVNV